MTSSPGHALITGASSGIGLALAHLLTRKAWRVSLLARNEEKLTKAIRQWPSLSQPPEILPLVADVTDHQALSRAFARAGDQFGPPSLVVANAGQVEPGWFTALSPEVFRQMMEVNYFGAVETARLALEYLPLSPKASLIFVSSGAALTGLAGYSAYAPSKCAVRGLAESLRNEYAPRGLHIGLVYPPDTDTPQLAYENTRKPTATKAITQSGGTASPDTVARAIYQGYSRRRFLITPGWRMFFLARVQGLLTPLLWRQFDKIVRRHPPDEPSSPKE